MNEFYFFVARREEFTHYKWFDVFICEISEPEIVFLKGIEINLILKIAANFTVSPVLWLVTLRDVIRRVISNCGDIFA
ncbi:hypothetical protein BpHYR1_047493 [Brachionus plicatilis]|uniref:Uncharacterized protein n=1 Tax=Brachionus plicatilis TaxID=10195 RepID=A0A3M7QF78_BRAPC|nr:hypothetical protein BpHYR1_047493 [Brachionus plicatilis]